MQFEKSANRQDKSAHEHTKKLNNFNKANSKYRSSAQKKVLENLLSFILVLTQALTLYIAFDL